MKVEVKSTESQYTVDLLVDDIKVGQLSDCEFGRWVCSIDDEQSPFYGCFSACDDTPAGIAYSIGQCVEGVTSMFADGVEVAA